MASQHSVRADRESFSSVLEQLPATVPFSFAAVISTLPRGGFQVTQAYHLPEGWLKTYTKTAHKHDRLTLAALTQKKALRADECWPDKHWQSSSYYGELMPPHRVQHAVVIPLRAPVLNGYDGALHLYRTADLGSFESVELEKLTEIAAEMDAAAARARASRVASMPRLTDSVRHRASTNVFAFDSKLHPVLGGEELSRLDEGLRQAILAQVKTDLAKMTAGKPIGDRVTLPDSSGDRWPFRSAGFAEFPAIDGPVVFLCLQPEVYDWAAVVPQDFAADNEISRLVPAISFMIKEYHRGPTLHEISKVVHLSPFHFHRRFTELLGITPKHLLLDSQIERAKRELISREMELANVAKACGFAHQSHFTSRFKQATGLTPTRWRRLVNERMAK